MSDPTNGDEPILYRTAVGRLYRQKLELAEKHLEKASDAMVEASRHAPSKGHVRGIALVRASAITGLVGCRELAAGAVPRTSDVDPSVLERGAGDELDISE